MFRTGIDTDSYRHSFEMYFCQKFFRAIFHQHIFFVYSKSEYTLKSITMSGRLHNNSSKSYPTMIDFLRIELSYQYLDQILR